MSVLKKRALAVLLSFIFVIFVAGYFFLSGRTFYASLVADKVGDAFRVMGGYALGIDDLWGNPLTGVDGTGIRIVHDGVELASADRIAMRVDWASVLSSPKLSQLSLSGLTADIDTVLNHLPQQKQESSDPPALERLTLRDSKISTPYGDIDVRDLTVILGDGSYRIDLRGTYHAQTLSVEADLRTLGGEMALRQFTAEWGGMKLLADGIASPSLDLFCDVSNIDMNLLSNILPQIKSADVQGLYSAQVRLRNDNDLSAIGEIQSKTGRIWRIPFDGLRTNFDYANGRVEIRDLNVALFGGAVSGDVRIALSPDSQPTVDLDLFAQGMDTVEARSVIPSLEQLSARIDIACDVSGAIDHLGGRIFLHAKKIEGYGFEGTDASADIRLSDSASLTGAFEANALGTNVRGMGKAELKPAIRLDLDVDASNIALETLAVHFPQVGEAGVKGIGNAHVKVHGPLDALVVDGSVSFPSIIAMNEYELKEVTAGFSYGKNGFALAEAKGTFNEATITAEGNHAAKLLDEGQNLDFKGSVSNLNIENFSNLSPVIRANTLRGTVSGKWNLSGTIADPRIHVALTAPAFSLLKRFALSEVAAEAIYRDASIEVVKASARMGKASASAAGKITLPVDGSPLVYNVKGSFDDLNPEDFVKMGLVSADLSGDLTGDFRVWSENGEAPSVRVFFKDSHFVYANIFDVSNLRGSVTLRDGDVHLDRLRTVINSGYISVTGSVGNILSSAFALENIPLNLDVSIASADIGRISRFFKPNSKGYQGVVTGNAAIEGSAADPRFKGSASLTGVRAFGLFLPIVRFNEVSGSMSEIQFPRVRAIVGRGVIDGHGSLRKTSDWRASVEATGRSVDIRSLTFSLEREARREINGTLDFEFKGDGWLDSFEGSGEIRVPTFSAMGIKITDFSAPFWVNEGFVMIEDSSAKGYGGVLKAQIAKDLTLTNWGGRLEVLSADFASLFKDLMPDAEGTITGSADLTLRLEGDSMRTSMQDGSGSFVIRNGEITGFPGTEAVSKITRGRPLRFSSAAFPFSIDGKTLYFLPGTRVTAPSDDSVFNYVMADGSIVIEEKKISLSCIGNVNLRALNSLIGGLQGLVTAAMNDTANTGALLQNFLGGALSGFSRNEFRDVSFVVKGTPGDIHFSDIEITQPLAYEARPEVLNQTVNSRETEEERFQLKVEFPVGPGGGHSNNVGGQVGGQVFEQALKNLFSF